MGRHYKGYSFDWSIYKMYDEQGDVILLQRSMIFWKLS